MCTNQITLSRPRYLFPWLPKSLATDHSQLNLSLGLALSWKGPPHPRLCLCPGTTHIQWVAWCGGTSPCSLPQLRTSLKGLPCKCSLPSPFSQASFFISPHARGESSAHSPYRGYTQIFHVCFQKTSNYHLTHSQTQSLWIHAREE